MVFLRMLLFIVPIGDSETGKREWYLSALFICVGYESALLVMASSDAL